MRLSHVAINVTDLAQSVSFYREALGYEPVGSWLLSGDAMASVMGVPGGTTGRNTFLKGAEAKVLIELIEWAGLQTGSVPARPGERGIVLLSYTVTADEIHDLWAKITTAGGTCATKPMEVHVAGQDLIAFLAEDPDGNMLEFIAANVQPASDETGRDRP